MFSLSYDGCHIGSMGVSDEIVMAFIVPDCLCTARDKTRPQLVLKKRRKCLNKSGLGGVTQNRLFITNNITPYYSSYMIIYMQVLLNV